MRTPLRSTTPQKERDRVSPPPKHKQMLKFFTLSSLRRISAIPFIFILQLTYPLNSFQESLVPTWSLMLGNSSSSFFNLSPKFSRALAFSSCVCLLLSSAFSMDFSVLLHSFSAAPAFASACEASLHSASLLSANSFVKPRAPSMSDSWSCLAFLLRFSESVLSLSSRLSKSFNVRFSCITF